ncbi:MAG: hypothetical protein ABIR79_12760 [Candidatus Binatia bacterium]
MVPASPRADTAFLPIEREIAGPALLARLQALKDPPAPFQTMVVRNRDGRRRSFAALRRAGVTILVGSDACHPWDVAGAGMHLELTTLVEAGMTPGEALRAATSDNARFLAGPDAPSARSPSASARISSSWTATRPPGSPTSEGSRP